MKNQILGVERNQKILHQYRQSQLLVNLSNYCFQDLFWPNMEFAGSVVIIALFYIVLICHSLLPLFALFSLCSIAVTILLMCCLMFQMGSNLKLTSAKILKRSKCGNISKQTRKIFRTCRPVEVCVGSFHKMDQGRCPSFIRFVVQRTFFLVFKTKLSTQFCNNIVVRIP